jgi:predicted SAM-dependent methyltransferase
MYGNRLTMNLNIVGMYKNLKRLFKLYVAIWNQRKEIRIVVGSGGHYPNGWIPTDIDTLNITKKSDWEKLFRINSIQAILAEHVWEHLTTEDGFLAIQNCFTYLKIGGYLRIAVPDGFHPDVNYIDHVKIGGTGPGANDHKILYTYRSLSTSLTRASFKVDLLEYFDEDGNFHAKDWDLSTGKINRSIRFDKRNEDGIPHYTSLIVDAIKEQPIHY